MHRFLPLAFLLAAAICAAPARAARPSDDFYVSPRGNDRWSGRLPAPNRAKTDGPLATLGRARDAVRGRIAAGLTRDVRVLVRTGTYYLPDGLTLGAPDSGTAAHRITWAAFPGETPTLVGGMRVTGWTRHRGNIWRAPLPGDAQSRPLFENNERRTPARTPNTGYLRGDGQVEGQARTAFRYRQGDLDFSGSDTSEARVFLWPGSNWFSADKPVTQIDPATRTITLGTSDGYDMRSGDRFFVYNSLALLDAPGEAFVSAKERAVYVWPKHLPIEKQNFVIATAPSVLAIRGEGPDRSVRNVHFEGLNFSVASGDVVNVTDAADCSVRFCRIENGGACGVKIAGRAQRVTVYGNEIRENGWHGVSLAGLPPGQPDVNKFHRVENNHIHHCGRLVGHGYGVEISQSGHNQILHNHIHHMPRYGTTIKGVRYQSLRKTVSGVTWENHWGFLHGRNNRIAYNHIHHVNLDSQDTGAMESWGPGRDNVYDHNLIHDVGNAQFDLQSGLYLDDATDYFTVTNNIIYNVRGAGGDQPIYAKGIGNRIENNILIVHPTNANGIRSLEMADERTDNHIYRRNLIVFEKAGAADAPRGSFGPGLANIHAPGTTFRWKFTVPRSGIWDLWFYYAADNTGDRKDMPNATTVRIDGGAPVTLARIPNTGGWGERAWNRVAARLTLTKGQHTLRWTNVEGGGLNWDAWAVTEDPGWRPKGDHVAEAAPGKYVVLVQAEAHLDAVDPAAKRPVYQFDNWSDDRVAASDDNLFWNPAGGITIKGGPASGDWSKWRSLLGGKYDAHSVLADPGFVDAAKRDYRLRPDSPARKLGFRNIDAGKIGLKPDFPKRLPRE